MQNLLDDPVFYNLLVNNNESSTIEPTAENVANPVNGELNNLVFDGSVKQGEFDMTFLDKVMFPMNGMILNGGANDSTSTPSEQSFTTSIFSDANQLNNNGSVIDGIDFNSVNEFLGKVPAQLSYNNTPTTTTTKLQPQPQPLPQQKQFHRFYTTTNPSLPSPTVAKPALTYHKCPFCQRQFKNKSYLSRHLKKHDTVKDFKCPFFDETHTKCHHLNGEFSRKDTFKAHLKSIHFIYPIGVAKSERNTSSGRCAGCFKEFSDNNEWLSSHIEKESCAGFAINKKY